MIKLQRKEQSRCCITTIIKWLHSPHSDLMAYLSLLYSSNTTGQDLGCHNYLKSPQQQKICETHLSAFSLKLETEEKNENTKTTRHQTLNLLCNAYVAFK